MGRPVADSRSTLLVHFCLKPVVMISVSLRTLFLFFQHVFPGYFLRDGLFCGVFVGFPLGASRYQKSIFGIISSTYSLLVSLRDTNACSPFFLPLYSVLQYHYQSIIFRSGRSTSCADVTGLDCLVSISPISETACHAVHVLCVLRRRFSPILIPIPTPIPTPIPIPILISIPMHAGCLFFSAV